MSEHTPGQWRIPGANVFRVVAPDAPHQNKPSGKCPPYAWAVVCETDPESVGGPQAAANARLIASAPELLVWCKRLSADLRAALFAPANLEVFGRLLEGYCDEVDAVVAKAEGVKSSVKSTVP